jgi:peroxiredoxin
LRSIQRSLPAFQQLGIQPVAISADTPDEAREMCRKAGLTFPVLSDRNVETVRHYDLLSPKAGLEGRDVSGAAEFLLDSSGIVRWRKLSEGGPSQFLAAAKLLP